MDFLSCSPKNAAILHYKKFKEVPEYAEMRHYMVASRNNDVTCLPTGAFRFLFLPAVEINRIHHWCLVGTGKSNSRATFPVGNEDLQKIETKWPPMTSSLFTRKVAFLLLLMSYGK